MKKRAITISLLTMMMFSLTACGDTKENTKETTTKVNVVFSDETTDQSKENSEDMETYLKNAGIISGEKQEKAASMIGALDGYSYPDADVEVYEYDTDSDAYKTIVDTGKVTISGFGDFPVAAVNGKYILMSETQTVIDAFKNYTN